MSSVILHLLVCDLSNSRLDQICYNALMLKRIILSVIVGIAVALVCLLLGALLITIKVDFAVAIGEFLNQYAGVIGLLAGIWYYFTGQTLLK